MINFKRQKKRKFYLITFAVILIISLITFIKSSKKDQSLETNFYSQTTKTEIMQTSSPQKIIDAETFLENELKNFQGTYAIYIKDLKTGKNFGFNQNLNMEIASIYKLAVMYKTYAELEKGNIKKDDPIAGTSIENALNKMITISDNDAAQALAEKFGWATIDRFIKKEGATNFNIASSSFPNSDPVSISVILEKIYYKQAVSKNASEEMLNLLLAQKINDRIPKFLPSDVRVAHKTGELEETRNDAGIIFGKKSDYVFVILSKTSKPQIAVENIAKLSQKMYEFLENQSYLK